MPLDTETRIRAAWQGRISGCQLGKPIELLSMRHGHEALADYLRRADAMPLRDYVPDLGDERVDARCCRDRLVRAEADDDLDYSLLAVELLEQHGLELDTVDVARAWLLRMPAARTYTAERAAYSTLLARGAEWFPEGADPGFDLAECADNPYHEWIGAQIRADVYGWVLPGRPVEAAALAERDARLSHRGAGVDGARFVAALGAAVAVSDLDHALDSALALLDDGGRAAAAVRLGWELAGDADGGAAIRQAYDGMSPVHTVNNLALVVWALLSHPDDFGAAIGDVVAAGLDTDCNGATVGALWGLHQGEVPAAWTEPWNDRVAFSLAGVPELGLDELVERTVTLVDRLAE
ncbi:MAG: ADP-ribosylglycohydrolase family protein [Actinomycetota bacterium]